MSDSTPVLCPVCGKSASFAFSAGDAFYGATSFRADLFRCGSCGCLSQWPMPERKVVADFYPPGYWQEERRASLMARLQGAYIHFMLNVDLMGWVKRLKLPRGARFLEVGCSRGDWLALIEASGLVVQGIEANPRTAAYARRCYGIPVSQADGDSWVVEPGLYQAVGFFHLLEHLRDPAAFLAMVHRALEPGGKLLLRVPNLGSLQSRLLGKRWKGLEMPRHLVMFTVSGLKGLLRQQGFKILKSSSWSLRDGPTCLASSLLPAGEPTWQQVKDKHSSLLSLCYLLLTWLLTPLELVACFFGAGSMITIIAEKP